MIKSTPKIFATKEIIGHEEIYKRKYKLSKGRKLLVTTVSANGKKEHQIKKLYNRGGILAKSSLLIFDKSGHRDNILFNVVV